MTRVPVYYLVYVQYLYNTYCMCVSVAVLGDDPTATAQFILYIVCNTCVAGGRIIRCISILIIVEPEPERGLCLLGNRALW
jgi:hypothetical protein